MESSEFVVLDIKAFDAFIAQKESFVQRYNDINASYNNIVKTLLENWKGKGAEAFGHDAEKVKRNIGNIYDVLKTMCDTLTDCRQIYEECDKALGEYNRNPEAG